MIYWKSKSLLFNIYLQTRINVLKVGEEKNKENLEHSFNQILLKYYSIKKINILKHKFKDSTKFNIADWVESISGTATKRMDFIKINLLDNRINDIQIECGTGLRSQNMSHTPLIRNLKNTFEGDNNLEVESEVEYRGDKYS